MTSLLRRNLIIGVAAATGGCSLVQRTSAQIIADITGATRQLHDRVIPELGATTPPIVARPLAGFLQADLADALALLTGISQETPANTGATVLSEVLGGVASVVGILAELFVPPPWSVILEAAAIILKEVDNYITGTIPGVPPSGVSYKLVKKLGHGMTIEQARLIIRKGVTS